MICKNVRWWNLSLLILISALVVGAFLLGRYSSASHPTANKGKETVEEEAKDVISVRLSDESKPEEGLYLISVKNNTDHLYYFVPRLGFFLQEEADGYQEYYNSSPHGQFSGFSLLPYTTFQLRAKLTSGDGFLKYEPGGTNIYLSHRDKLFLSVDLRISELDEGTCQELSFNLPLDSTPSTEFLDAEVLLNRKQKYFKPSESNFEDLLPLDDIPID